MRSWSASRRRPSEPPRVQWGRRIIALDPSTIAVLKAQAARQLDEQNDWDKLWIESGLVLTAENGGPLEP